MSAQFSRILIGLSGIFGTILLGAYFGVGFSIGLAQLPASAPLAQVISAGTQYRDLWFLGTWLQATGSLLSVIFFLALVQRAGKTTRMAGLLAILGSTVLLAVVLLEGVFTMDLAQAATDGHQMAALSSFDVMTVFTYIYPIVPAPLIFLALGTILLRTRVLPLAYGYVALGLGVAFEIVGLIGPFTTSILTLVVLSLQGLWAFAAAIAWLAGAGRIVKATVGLERAG
ncbi:MAG TPA: hypothetical protein VKV40_11420 [Ktedonobacteraceae bacterium]|nr:hypothetical protein [Ktedonobacteraceae bacterium]